jgi:dTDP-4-dehydrorhamnose reductase
MRIAVTGAGGLLGSALCRELGNAALPLDYPSLDLADAAAVRRAVDHLRPDVLVNTAAYTQVDAAESNAAACRAVNVEGVAALAEACARSGAALVQMSTDYVFGNAAGRLPLREEDPPSPRGVYALSKLDGEKAAALCPRHLIVRSCGLYGPTGPSSGKRNFVDSMLALADRGGPLRVVADQWVSPSYVLHVARAIRFLVDRGAAGICHVVNPGVVTWHAFAVEILRQAGKSVEVLPISTAEYGAAAPRPAYSALDPSRYLSLGGPPLPDWRAALAEFLAEPGR